MGKISPNIRFPQTGDIVEPGTYACVSCPHDSKDNESVAVLSKAGRLPKCPVCGFTLWMKVAD